MLAFTALLAFAAVLAFAALAGLLGALVLVLALAAVLLAFDAAALAALLRLAVVDFSLAFFAGLAALLALPAFPALAGFLAELSEPVDFARFTADFLLLRFFAVAMERTIHVPRDVAETGLAGKARAHDSAGSAPWIAARMSLP
ncbi:hypothetical protein [Haliangium ochraceum]|uniref:hypothetical protein n=1 Tax=Haliangium ochraceum TaxID=80816 RepID=UPI00019B9540|nr:hypothetical protein [Haliangium ochraceum]